MGILIELADQDYQYCLDYASGKTNTMALSNISRIIKATADGTRYENRLKADMVAILENLKKEMNPIKECEQQIYGKEHWNFVGKCQDVIQDKINKLEGES